jgi:hypothetical protein
VGRRSAVVKLGTLDGRNIPLETHMARLNVLPVLMEARRLCFGNCRPSVQKSFYWKNSTIDLVSRRWSKSSALNFAPEGDVYKGESIKAIYHEIQRLLALSFPGETGTLSKIVARDAFLDILADPEMRIRILNKGATTIEQAYALKYESFLAGSVYPLPTDQIDRRRVRGIHPQHEVGGTDASLRAKMDKMEKSVTEFREGLAQLIRASQQSMPQGSGPSASGTTAPTTSGREQQPWKNRQRLSGVSSDRRC